MLCSKGAADHVTERTYGSKEKARKKQEIEGMGIEEKRDKDKWGTLHCRDLGVARNFSGQLTFLMHMEGDVKSDGEVLREKEMALKRALEIEKEMALKMLEIKADEALMPELYREMSQWQKRNQWDIDHAEANKDGKIRMLSRMQDEV